MDRFQRPTEIIGKEGLFSQREVGITHPDTKAFARFRDNGDVEVFAVEGCGIYLNATKRSITLIAEEIRILTPEGKAIRWNDHDFNPNATSYHEPALIPHESIDNLYRGVEEFLVDDDGEVLPDVMVTDPETGEEVTFRQYYQKYQEFPKLG